MQEMPTVGEEKSLEQNKHDLREFVGFYPSIARRMGKDIGFKVGYVRYGLCFIYVPV